MSVLARPLPITRPITDMRTSLNDVCRQATETQEPILLTKNGVASYVLMDCDAYNKACENNRVYLALREAEIEEEHCHNSVTDEEVRKSLHEIFALWGIDYDA